MLPSSPRCWTTLPAEQKKKRKKEKLKKIERLFALLHRLTKLLLPLMSQGKGPDNLRVGCLPCEQMGMGFDSQELMDQILKFVARSPPQQFRISLGGTLSLQKWCNGSNTGLNRYTSHLGAAGRLTKSEQHRQCMPVNKLTQLSEANKLLCELPVQLKGSVILHGGPR